MAAGHHPCTLLLITLLVAATATPACFAARDHPDVDDDGAGKKPTDAEPSYYGGGYGYGGGFIPPGSIPFVPAAASGGGGGGWGAGYGGPYGPGAGGRGGGGWGAGYGGGPGAGGGYAHGGVQVPPPVVCQEKGPCYGKKLACPKRCFWSYSRSGDGYGAGGGGGSCTIDCTAKCTASC